MTTIVNSPGGSGEGSGMGVVIGVLVAIVVIVLFFVYALPAIRGGQSADNGSLDVNLNLPGGSYSTPASGGTGTGY